jgi:hypothetical protein
MEQWNARKDYSMVFELNDVVLATGKVLRKNPSTGEPETLNFSEEEGTVKKLEKFEGKPEKNTYWIETQYGVNVFNGKNLVIKPEEE